MVCSWLKSTTQAITQHHKTIQNTLSHLLAWEGAKRLLGLPVSEPVSAITVSLCNNFCFHNDCTTSDYQSLTYMHTNSNVKLFIIVTNINHTRFTTKFVGSSFTRVSKQWWACWSCVGVQSYIRTLLYCKLFRWLQVEHLTRRQTFCRNKSDHAWFNKCITVCSCPPCVSLPNTWIKCKVWLNLYFLIAELPSNNVSTSITFYHVLIGS